ncbi:undecaprenyl-diphosphate phosphatase [Salinibacter sp.]|uniref:undecaprenyl-diphosphate phosphatase n=1 Tax=Salinibacter sp. TaxID=2065818 RepID=UPI0021E7DDE5|nr:undecaprenyl-diphosphate phosphatase [Salinibacter sp.]
MTWWEALLLGLIQGLTEFIPVSSSGHLVLGQYLLGLDKETADVTFEVFVHFGTVLSILTVYWDEVAELLGEAWAGLRAPGEVPARYADNETFRLGVFILVTLVPTGVAYVLFRESLEQAFRSPRLTSAMLLVTGLLLLLTMIRPQPEGELNGIKAVVVGVAQSFAMIPGISRSGATICTALYQNVKPERAANFSFLMLLPVVTGATILKGLELVEQGLGTAGMPLLLGTVAAYGSGIGAIYVVLDVVRRGNLQYFAYYCFLIGGLGLWLL